MRRAAMAVAAGMVLVAAACGNASDDSSSGDDPATSDEVVAVDQPGVSDTEIRIGGVASVTNPLGGKYGDAFDGVKAYFDMVNADGGIYGRDLVLAEERDDKLANNKAEIDALIDADVFAIAPVATLLFTGADSAVAAGIPTFGWTINPEWEGTPEEPKANLFGQTGSYLGFDAGAPGLPWLANDLGATKVGVLAYTAPQSALCADGVTNSFEKYADGTDAQIAFVDKALSYGETNLSVQVQKMKEAGVDLVTTCMDTNGVVTLAREMKKQQLDAEQYLPNGYDHEFIAEFGDLFEGSIVRTDFVPWEIPEEDQPEGLKNYLEWMDKAGVEPSENSVAGWLNADLLVTGLREAGPDFTRQKVIDAINSLTDYTAEGFVSGVDWTVQHTQKLDPDRGCDVKMRVQNSEFVTAYSEPGAPFHCVDGSDPANLTATNEP